MVAVCFIQHRFWVGH